MSNKVIYREIYGNNERENVIIKSDKKLVTKPSSSSRIKNLLSIVDLKLFLKEVFLPKGFPHSVHRDYIAYQIWDTAFASTILGTLTTHSILQGVGVGESTATPLAAAISWILKDGTGLIGRILFAWWNGSDLDAQSKKWRLFADILNDIAMGIELTLPYFSPSSITLILCVSTAMKSIVGVAGGATRAALTQHQALTNNLADVSAKDGSQETFVNLVASFVGIFILSTLQNSFLIELYLLLVAVHIYANYSAVKALRLNSLNEDRLVLLLNNYMLDGTILDVEKINQQESLMLFQRPSKKYCGFNIILGTSLSNVLDSYSINSVEFMVKLINHHRHKQYLILINHRADIIHRGKFCTSGPLAKLYAILQNDNSWNLDEYQLVWQTMISINRLLSQEFKWWCELLDQSEWDYSRNLLPDDNWRGYWD
ncbi:hypothetical protein PV327_010637 [Microctonus hyperodae]|uniref:Protein root UVB sensitive/RUS domain-containing protein n=1 Tax=Microctonus hyperodae TaxID=165561 RepID=A0AA39FSM3_MICHY|nr:hypothetical protein PV327_010637 [Microctonus hyperodae]